MFLKYIMGKTKRRRVRHKRTKKRSYGRKTKSKKIVKSKNVTIKKKGASHLGARL